MSPTDRLPMTDGVPKKVCRGGWDVEDAVPYDPICKSVRRGRPPGRPTEASGIGKTPP